MVTYTVYGIYQDDNQLVYIGSTMQPLRVRFNQHCCKTKKKKISQYILSIGKERFTIKPIISNIKNKIEAFEKEKELTLHYRNLGYNLQNVNDGNSYTITEEQRIKFRNAKLGKHNNHLSKKVICVETNEIFPSIAEVARKFNVSHNAIEQAIKKGSNYTSCGYHWKYYI